MKYPNTGLIFDMDNTLIRSFIDYALMKSETVRLLRHYGLPADEAYPVAKMMAIAKDDPACTDEIDAAIWQRINEVEDAGLGLAVAEDGVLDLIADLSADTNIFVLTNNVHQSAEKTLRRMGILPHLAAFAGRGVVPQLKPSPAGYQYLLQQKPAVSAASSLALGDALLDIQAASALGIDFIAYNGSREEDWQKHDVLPCAYLHRWDDKALQLIRGLLAQKQEGYSA